MSEQSPLQSSVGVFVEWAKARLDEMAASAKVLESRLDSLDVNIRADALSCLEPSALCGCSLPFGL
jgi:hypothetical protein